jgi:hypothetical protein
MSETTLEDARARYLTDLQREHPQFNEQMSDVLHVLHSLLGEEKLPALSPLDSVRAEYVGYLRAHVRTLDEQVRELAKACTQLFAPSLGLTDRWLSS